MTSELLRWLKPLTSLKLTIFCLACAMVLVFLGTLDQVHIGVYEAENRYFKSLLPFLHSAWYGSANSLVSRGLHRRDPAPGQPSRGPYRPV